MQEVALFPLNIYKPFVIAACTERLKTLAIFSLISQGKFKDSRIIFGTEKKKYRYKSKYFRRVFSPSEIASSEIYGRINPF